MVLNSKRAQAAMEFLMTYGWAILVVLVVIGALAYFGVLNPQTLLPERCELQQGFFCKDHRISTLADTVSFSFQNGRGQDMMLLSINVTSPELGVTCTRNFRDGTATADANDGATETYATKEGHYIANGATDSSIVISGCAMDDALAGIGKRKFDLEIVWYDFTSDVAFDHTMGGQLLANLES